MSKKQRGRVIQQACGILAISLIILATLIIETGTVSASEIIASGNCNLGGTVTWSLTDDGVLTIEGQGEIPDTGDNWGRSYEEYKDVIKSIVISEGITGIGNYNRRIDNQEAGS